MKIGMIQNDSPYDIQEFLFRQMKEILEAEGHDTEIIPLDYFGANDQFEDIMMTKVDKGNFDLVFTIDLTGFERRLMEDECFYNNLYCPMIHLLTKDAWYFSSYLNQRLNFSMFFYIENEYNTRYIRDTFRHFPNIETLAPVGFALEQKPWEERSHDVYFPAAYAEPNQILAEIEQLPEVFGQIAKKLIARMMAKNSDSFYDEVRGYFKEIQFECGTEEMIDIMTELSPVTRYIKMYYADQCVRELLRAGIRVTVSGKGWNTFEAENGRMPEILGDNGLSYEECLRTMGNSKIVLHNQSHKGNDISERVINGLLQGAAVLSDRTYPDEKINQEIHTYDKCHLERLPELVEHILKSPHHEAGLCEEDYSLRPAVLKMVENCFS